MQETDNNGYLVAVLYYKKHGRIVFSRSLCCMFFLCVILIWEAVFLKMVQKTFHHTFAKTVDTFSLKGVALYACHVCGLTLLVHYTHHVNCSELLQALKFEACCAVCLSQCLVLKDGIWMWIPADALRSLFPFQHSNCTWNALRVFEGMPTEECCEVWTRGKAIRIVQQERTQPGTCVPA